MCNYALTTTLAVEDIGDGAAHLHERKAPTAEGDGKHFPNFLVDAEIGKLIHHSAEEIKNSSPPGSIEKQIVKSPCDHLWIAVNEHAKLIAANADGRKEPIPTLDLCRTLVLSNNQNVFCFV